MKKQDIKETKKIYIHHHHHHHVPEGLSVFPVP